jgi:hypothetical protein
MRESVGWARELLGGNGILLEHNVGRLVADAEAVPVRPHRVRSALFAAVVSIASSR